MTLAVIRVLAPNPSIATLDGTNTWIVGEEPTIVIDPGPEIGRASCRERVYDDV